MDAANNVAKTAKAIFRNGRDVRPRGPGRPFPKGVSGNPNGMKQLTPEEKAARLAARKLAREVALGNMKLDMICRQHAPLAVQALVELVRHCEEPSERRLAAAELLNRGFGKPTETQIVAAAVGVSVGDGVNALTEAMAVLREAFAHPAPRVINESA
jgi:hypothetical protein